MDKRDGFINATKMCASGGKSFFAWTRNETNKQLMQTLEVMNSGNGVVENTHDDEKALQGTPLQICRGVCRYVENGNKSDLDRLVCGTYIHPDLVPSVAGWVSPFFQLKANRVVNEYIMEEYRVKLAASEQAATELLSSLQTTQIALDSSIECNALLQGDINDLQAVANLQNTVINIKQEEIGQLHKKVDHKTRERRVWASTHGFAMLQLNDQTSHRSHYAIRCLGHRLNTAINKLKRKHPSAQIIYRNQHVPNAINLYKRLKSHRIVEYKHNYCTPTCSQFQLLHLLDGLCEDAYSTPLLKSDAPCIIKQETASQ
jgi:hypothetical protein